jgi:mannobiose 2-epimerase
MDNKLIKLKSELEQELVNNILPFWETKMIDQENGGFLGRIDGNGMEYRMADKGCVMNARILWTFSSASRILHHPEYLIYATRAKDYLLNYFADKQYGGVYWMLNYKGNIADGKKQIYAQAFTLYALVEYYRATGDESTLKQAIGLYEIIEKYSFDKTLGGYFEAFSREWGELGDLRLSAKDANEKKTMNTHLHVLEAYTNLYRVWKDESLGQQLRALIEIFLTKIVNNQTYHLNMFFTENWDDKTDLVSYGHDIECSWLLYEAAVVLGDKPLIVRTKETCLKIAKAACEGLMPDGSMVYEHFFENGRLDTDRHWWVQAETLVGLYNAYELSGDAGFLDKALNSWKFISANIIDKQQGEWFWSVNEAMEPNHTDDKAGFWKCPYHNSRMCFEIMERVAKL